MLFSYRPEAGLEQFIKLLNAEAHPLSLIGIAGSLLPPHRLRWKSEGKLFEKMTVVFHIQIGNTKKEAR